MLANVWDAESGVQLEQTDLILSGLTYPGVQVSCYVHRKPKFYEINVVLPSSLFALIAMCQIWIPAEEIGDRLSVSMTLLLAAVAYKIVTASMLPAIPYLTILDSHVSLCSLVILAVVFEAPVVLTLSKSAWVRQVLRSGSDMSSTLKVLDSIAQFCIFVAWVYVNALFVLAKTKAVFNVKRMKAERDINCEEKSFHCKHSCRSAGPELV